MPPCATANPISTGPLTNAPIWIVEWSATAIGNSRRSTSWGSSAARAGPSKAAAAATIITAP